MPALTRIKSVNVNGVLIFVKSTQTESAAKTAAQLSGRNGFVMTLQNGMGNADTIAAYVESNRILVGTNIPWGHAAGCRKYSTCRQRTDDHRHLGRRRSGVNDQPAMRGGLDFTAIGGKRQGSEAPNRCGLNRVRSIRFGNPNLKPRGTPLPCSLSRN